MTSRYILVESGCLYNNEPAFRICKGYFKDGELIDNIPIRNIFNLKNIPDLKSLEVFYFESLSRKLQNRNRLI